MIRNLLQDIRFGLRVMGRQRGLTAMALLALALGIGGVTAVYSVVYGVLLAQMPYPHANQLVMVWSRVKGHRIGVTAANYLAWKHDNRVFQSIGAWEEVSGTLTSGGIPRFIRVRRETPGLLAQTGAHFLFGGDFAAADGQPGHEREAILTHKLWQAHLQSDPRIVGRQVDLDGGLPYTVVGVLAAGVYDRGDPIIEPLAFSPQDLSNPAAKYMVMARLKPGVGIAQAHADIAAIAERIDHLNPTEYQGFNVAVDPLHDDFLLRPVRSILWIFLVLSGLILLIACADVANLLLAAAAARVLETAVRAALGATHRRLVRQFLLESLMLSFGGGALGIGVGWVLLRWFLVIFPLSDWPVEARIGLYPPVLLVALALSVGSGLLAATIPAWNAGRIELNERLKDGGRSGNAGRSRRIQSLLAVAEFGMALGLLGLAGMEAHSLFNILQVRLRFHHKHVMVGRLEQSDPRFANSPGAIWPFYSNLLGKVRAVPGVRAAALSGGVPAGSMGAYEGIWRSGTTEPPEIQQLSTSIGIVTPGYLRTFGIRLIEGRAISAEDTVGSPPVALVNERLAGEFLKGQDPLGAQLLTDRLTPDGRFGKPVELRVIGVYANVPDRGIEQIGREPQMLVPFAQFPFPSMMLDVRADSDPLALQNAIALAIRSVDPSLPWSHVRTMDQIIAESYSGDRSLTICLTILAAIALMLAVAGVYGVVSFAVAQRTHEIGIRMALGATRGRIMRQILGYGLRLALAGAVLGLIGVILGAHELQSLGVYFNVATVDWVTLVAVTAILSLVALAGCYVPARRAMHIDPMAALRDE